MSEDYEIVVVQDGVRQCRPMPSSSELDEFYEEKYFQTNQIYAQAYDEREIAFFRDSVHRKLALLGSTLDHRLRRGSKVLEVGVGEGWTLQVLDELGFEVTGVDYSDLACRSHNPGVSDRIRRGKPESVLDSLRRDGHRYDVIWLDNVLEHSPDPAGLLVALRDLAHEMTRLVIEVPNDYSKLQVHLLENNYISRPFWEAVPEHLSYFQGHGLRDFCAKSGWHQRRLMSDFPIDLYLLNEHSNYVERPDTGKAAHRARLTFEEIFRDAPLESMIRFLEAAAEIGLGRNLVGVFAPE